MRGRGAERKEVKLPVVPFDAGCGSSFSFDISSNVALVYILSGLGSFVQPRGGLPWWHYSAENASS